MAFSTKVSDSLAFRSARAPPPVLCQPAVREADRSRHWASRRSLLWEGLERAESVHIPFTFSFILFSIDLSNAARGANDSVFDAHVKRTWREIVSFYIWAFMPIACFPSKAVQASWGRCYGNRIRGVSPRQVRVCLCEWKRINNSYTHRRSALSGFHSKNKSIKCCCT